MWSLFTNGTFEDPIESFTSQLTSKHEGDLCLAGAPYQSGICDAQSLGYKGQKGTGMCNWIIGILRRKVSCFVSVGQEHAASHIMDVSQRKRSQRRVVHTDCRDVCCED
jgi:hypothetical protein